MMRVGSAKVYVTPPFTIPYLAYTPRHSYFEGVRDPLFARALAVEAGDERLVIVSVDVLGFSRRVMGPGKDFVAEIRRRVQAKTGIPEDRVMLAATHAHSTPELCNLECLLDSPGAAAWLDVFADQIAAAVFIASRRLEPVVAKAGETTVDGVSMNRRKRGLGPVDRSLQVIAFERPDGSLHSALVNFACHPVSVQVQPLVSADYPGVACGLVESAFPGAMCLFLQGAAGDIDPLRGTSGFRDVDLYGRIVGGAAIQVAARLLAPETPALGEDVKVKSQAVRLAGRPLPDPVGVREEREAASQALERASSDAERREAEHRLRVASYKARLLDVAVDPVESEIMAVRIGDAAICGIPGELFAELGTEIKQASPARRTLVSTMTNDWIGYLSTRQAWSEGGYEVGPGPWCLVGPDGGPDIARHAITLLKELWQ